MWLRVLLSGLLILVVVTTPGAQAPAPAPAAPSPGDKCLADLPQWQTYATSLKLSRDQLEQDLATLRAELARTKAALDAATKPAPKP